MILFLTHVFFNFWEMTHVWAPFGSPILVFLIVRIFFFVNCRLLELGRRHLVVRRMSLCSLGGLYHTTIYRVLVLLEIHVLASSIEAIWILVGIESVAILLACDIPGIGGPCRRVHVAACPCVSFKSNIESIVSDCAVFIIFGRTGWSTVAYSTELSIFSIHVICSVFLDPPDMNAVLQELLRESLQVPHVPEVTLLSLA